jgi:hypothetical protein
LDQCRFGWSAICRRHARGGRQRCGSRHQPARRTFAQRSRG